MTRLTTPFVKAKHNVEPTAEDKDGAQKAHLEVRTYLERDQTLQSYGIDTVLIGSYKRNVSIRRVKDVDVLSKLPKLPSDCDPRTLLQGFGRVLTAAYGPQRVELQDRSLKVDFPNLDLAVDVVPARPSLARPGLRYIEIPDKHGGWQETNPEKLTDLTIEMNKRYDGDYVPLVKLIRQTRRSNLGKRPGGFFFEILTYHASMSDLITGSDESLFVSALESIARQLHEVAALGMPVSDPTRPGESIAIRATPAQMAAAAGAFNELAAKARQAAHATVCEAALAYQQILGKNDDGDVVFEMPSACNADGTEKQLVDPRRGDLVVPAGSRRFA